MNEMLGIVLRILVMYFYVLALLRFSGKRSIGNLSPLDFTVAAIIGDMFDNVFWGETAVSQGLVGAGVIIFLHTLMSLIQARSKAAHHLLSGNPVTVLKDGSLVEKGLAQERTDGNEVWSHIREQGLEKEKAAEIREAAWETYGSLSVIRHRRAEGIQKADVDAIKRSRRAGRNGK